MSSDSYISKTYMKNILYAFGIVILSLLMLSMVFKVVKADEKTTTIIGHVITQKIQGNNMDHTEVFTNELNNLIHTFSVDMIDIIMEHMPNILDSISAELRQEADKQYKCSLQDDDYKNKECL